MFAFAGSAVYRDTDDDGNSYYITARHVINGAMYIDGHRAYMIAAGDGEDDCAVLQVMNYDPNVGYTVIRDLEENPVGMKEPLFYSNTNKYRTIIKVKAGEFGPDRIHTTTYAQLGNSGAGVFDTSGRLVGIVIERTKTCCECDFETVVLKISPVMLTVPMEIPVPDLAPLEVPETIPEAPEVPSVDDFSYFPPEEPEVIYVPGRG
jgi:hypothetical protein